MSVDIENEMEEQIDAAPEEPPNPATDLEGAVLQEQQEAALEYGSEPAEPANPEDDAEIRLAIELKMKDLFAEQHTGRRLREVEEKAKSAHTAAKKACEVQDERIKECIDELEALYLNEPDPARYPLLDKAAVNGMFAKPEAIQPLPPDTFAEFLRRKQMDTPLASMGFKAGTLRFLVEKMGLTTARDLVVKINEHADRGLDFGIAKGMTPLRFEEVVENLDEITKACQSEWDLAHPAEDGHSEAVDGPESDPGDEDGETDD